MNFVSWAFVALFAGVFVARLTIGRRKIEPGYVAVLLVSSLVFYAWHVPVYLGVLLFSSGHRLRRGAVAGRIPLEHRRRRLAHPDRCRSAPTSACSPSSSTPASSLQVIERSVGPDAAGRLSPELALALPMGISFYTFQSMSYTIDVYRGQLTPVRGLLAFLLFISFFPQLVAGPIVRAVEFLPQMPRPRRLRARVVYEGVVADHPGVLSEDGLRRQPRRVRGRALGARGRARIRAAPSPSGSALMFSGQIFADFAGYSNIARGSAYLLGYRLPMNFNAPYIAASFKNFWERWHITLSRWLRDYLYVSLGGNRRGGLRTYVNLLLVMVLGGLWHGAAYTFIVWGALHGGALARRAAARAAPVGSRLDRDPRPCGPAWFVVVQGVVLAAWVCFRSGSLEEGEAASWATSPRWTTGRSARWSWRACCSCCRWWRCTSGPGCGNGGWSCRCGRSYRAVLAAGMVYAIVTLYAGTADFIYFQF